MSGKNRAWRRRRQHKPPVAANLVLDDSLKGDVGLISDDLFAELFPHQPSSSSPSSTATTTYYIGITSWAPSATPTSSSWSLVPVRCASTASAASAGQNPPRPTIKFSPVSPALQSFALNLQELAPSRLAPQGSRHHGIEVLALDAVPLPLSAVYVSLEGDLAKRLRNGEGTFYSERPDGAARTSAAEAMDPEERLVAAVRIALGSLSVVHAGDLFSLPLPPHPITHVPPNPGRIVLCEPVGQGVLAEGTKVVVVTGGRGTAMKARSASLGSSRLSHVREDDEGMSTDQFYSATEEGAQAQMRANDMGDTTETEGGEDEEEEEDMLSTEHEEYDMSDDSMDDFISLEVPLLPATNASGVSTVQSGTPLAGPGRGRKTNGVTTPGSVFSSFTAATARQDKPRGRLFKARGLMRPLPTEVLAPKPAPDEDEEARIYVDITSLPKIGCFSGDWVRVEAAEEPSANGSGPFGPFGLGGLSLESEPANWRPAKVFGLPPGFGARPVTRIASSKTPGRRTLFFESQTLRPSSPLAYASPFFLANLDSAPYLRISPLKRPLGTHFRKGVPSKLTGVSRPPAAREVTIHAIQSQVSVDKVYQTAVLGGLKRYFSSKIRLVRPGDMLAVAVDAQLGKTMQEGSAATGSEVDDVMSLMSLMSLMATQHAPDPGSTADSVAWFRIGNVQVQRTDDHQQEPDDEFWASVSCFDTALARMNVSGAERSRVPGTKDSSWPYYLGVKKVPRRGRAPDLLAPLPGGGDNEQTHIPPIRRKLRELLAAATSPRAMGLNMAPVAVLLTSTHRSIGKTTTALDACADVGLHAYTIDAHDILTESEGGGGGGGGGGSMDVKTQGFLRARSDRAMSCGPHCCALVIRHLDALGGERTAASLNEILGEARVLVATANDVDRLPDHVRGLFTHEMEINAPDEAEREAILGAIVDSRGAALDPAVELDTVALKTAALVAGDLVDVVDRALMAKQARLEQMIIASASAADVPPSPSAFLPLTIRDVQLSGGPSAQSLSKSDFDVAVDAARKNFSDAIGAPKIPNVSWNDVGGLGNVKEAITETIQLPLERPELFARGLRKRSGMLFYGPPGTGKTLLAKAIATEYSLNFFSVKGPELLNMYVGESEANVRRVFARARDARPCVVFFDELDSVAPKRGNQGDSGGVMDRIVSQLLAELDGMSGGSGSGSGVFVIGATNRPDLLDPALLRPGRFDKMMYLGVSDTHEKQLTILEALTRRFELHPSVSLSSIANRLPLTYTGADFYALCSDAMLKAVTRQATAVDAKIRAINADHAAARQPSAATAVSHTTDASAPRTSSASNRLSISTAAFFDHFAAPEDVAVLVTEADFAAAQRELVPSVSASELAHYERVRASFEGARTSKDHHHQQTASAPPDTAAPFLGGGGGSGGSAGELAVLKVREHPRSMSRGKGKGKAVAVSDSYSSSKGKGKGKAVAEDEDVFEDELEARTRANKGKGKAVDRDGFVHGTASDDEALY